MSFVGDSRRPDGKGPGILPVQHHGFIGDDWPLQNRASVWMQRIVGRQDGEQQLGHWENEGEALGDWTGPMEWPNSTREVPTWRDVFPAILIDGASFSTRRGHSSDVKSSRGSSEEVAALPIFNEGETPDSRFAPLDVQPHRKGFQRFPRGTIGIVLAGTDENRQRHRFHATDGRLVAVNYAGDPEMGSVVCDLDDRGRYDPDRTARLQSAFRVVKAPSWGDVAGENMLAWQIGPSGQRDTFGGFICDFVQSSRFIQGVASPVFGDVSPAGSGPLCVGGGRDQHELGRDADGNPINAAHLTLNAYYYDEWAGVDGPEEFSGRYAPVTPGPFRVPARKEWDASVEHGFVLGARRGMLRFSADAFHYTPTGGPPPTTDTPDKGKPPTTEKPPDQPDQGRPVDIPNEGVTPSGPGFRIPPIPPVELWPGWGGLPGFTGSGGGAPGAGVGPIPGGPLADPGPKGGVPADPKGNDPKPPDGKDANPPPLKKGERFPVGWWKQKGNRNIWGGPFKWKNGRDIGNEPGHLVPDSQKGGVRVWSPPLTKTPSNLGPPPKDPVIRGPGDQELGLERKTGHIGRPASLGDPGTEATPGGGANPPVRPGEPGIRRPIPATTLQIAQPSFYGRPNHISAASDDLRWNLRPGSESVQRHDRTAPLTVHVEAWGNQAGAAVGSILGSPANQWDYTRQPFSGPALCSPTANGGYCVMPPEVDMADVDTDFAPVWTPKSVSYWNVLTDCYHSAGLPDLSTGGIRKGFRWGANPSGDLVFEGVNSAGSTLEVLRLTGSGADVVVNEGGSALVAFRVEGDSNENLIVTDPQQDRVGFKTAAPTTDFDFTGDSLFTGDMHVTGKLTVDGSIDPTDLTLTEQASVPGGNPSAGYGRLWSKTDKTLHYTDSDGTDYDLMAAGGGGVTAAQVMMRTIGGI